LSFTEIKIKNRLDSTRCVMSGNSCARCSKLRRCTVASDLKVELNTHYEQEKVITRMKQSILTYEKTVDKLEKQVRNLGGYVTPKE